MHEELLLAVPLASGGLVVDLDTVAVWVFDVDAQGQAVVGDPFDFYAVLVQVVVEIFQVGQGVHAPGHMVEAHLAIVGALGVGADFHQRNLMGLV